MKKHTFIFLLLAFTMKAHAQFGFFSSKSAGIVKKATLIVSMETEDPKQIKKLSSDSVLLNGYREFIRNRNEKLKKAAEEYWTFTESPLFMPEADALVKYKSDKSKYVIMRLGQTKEYDSFTVKSPMADGRTMKTTYKDLKNVITTLEIGNPNCMVSVNLPQPEITLSDAVYGIMQLQNILRYMENNAWLKFLGHVKDNGPGLKKVTLLLDKEKLEKGLAEASVKSVYPFPFKITDAAEVDHAIISRDSTVAYIELTNIYGGEGVANAEFVSSPADGKIYAIDSPKIFLSGAAINQMVTKGNLKTFKEKAEKK